MNKQRKQQLGKIIALSQDMLELARDNAWERVAELEEARRMLVMQSFHTPTSKQDSATVAAVIREILSLNQQLTDLGKAHRQHLGNELRTNQVGRTAQQAYRGCAR